MNRTQLLLSLFLGFILYDWEKFEVGFNLRNEEKIPFLGNFYEYSLIQRFLEIFELFIYPND